MPDQDYGTIAFGYMDSHHLNPYRLRLKNQAPLDEALPGTQTPSAPSTRRPLRPSSSRARSR